MTARKPESVCHRKMSLMKKTPRAGGASGEPHEAGKTQMSPHPGHGILTDTDRKAGYSDGGAESFRRERPLFPIGGQGDRLNITLW